MGAKDLRWKCKKMKEKLIKEAKAKSVALPCTPSYVFVTNVCVCMSVYFQDCGFVGKTLAKPQHLVKLNHNIFPVIMLKLFLHAFYIFNKNPKRIF